MKRDIETGLASLLSSGASISYPGSERYTNSNERFTELSRPDYQVVVHVANEDDVIATVCIRISFGNIISPRDWCSSRSNMPLPTTLPSSLSPVATV